MIEDLGKIGIYVLGRIEFYKFAFNLPVIMHSRHCKLNDTSDLHGISVFFLNSEVQRLCWPCTNEVTKTDQ